MLLAVVAVLAALHFGRDILIPLALAALVSFALGRPIARMEKLGCKRAWAVGIVMSGLMFLLTCTGWVVVTQMKRVVDELPNHSIVIKEKFSALASRIAAMEAAGQALVPDAAAPLQLPDVQEANAKPIQVVAGTSPDRPLYVAPSDGKPTLLQQIPAALGSLVSPIGTAGMVMLFAVFMLLNREDLRNRFLRLISNGDLTGTTRALTEASTRIGRYLGMQALINVTFGIAVALGLFLLGVPGWALWGFLFFLLRFLPYVGILLGASMPLAMALAASPGWGLFLATAVLFAVLELTVNLVLEPWLYSESAGVSPFAVLVAAAVWTWLWGPIGLLLAMPLTVVVVVLGKSVPQFGFLHVLLGTGEALSPTDRYYQRVMSNDPDEAIRILEEVAADKPLLDIYETVLVPGLTAAERDLAAGKLTDEEYESLCENIRDSLEAMEVRQTNPPGEIAATATAPATATATAAVFGMGVNPEAQPGVVCLPVKNGASEVAAAVLCRLLHRAGHPCRAFSTDLTIAEQLDRVALSETVCVVSLPDPTLRSVRSMCKRVKSRRPDLKVVVMAWGSAVDPSVWRYRALADCTDALATNSGDLALALARLRHGHLPPATGPADHAVTAIASSAG